uniref:Histone-lysine N-methyltransferase n=1 Tax=Proboscia inermis TaxID=420281 RepID=A0A7S0GGD2_9STRA
MPFGNWVHASCALWSSEVWEEGSGGQIRSVDKARQRGTKLKCFGCGRPGATLGCHKANCPSNFHFPCAYACGSVFTQNREMYCRNHRNFATDVLPLDRASFEHQKTLRIVDKASSEGGDNFPCFRVGALVVQSLGNICTESDGFHSKHYITPLGYTATRIFWSFVKARTRTLYILKVNETKQSEPLFTVRAIDNPTVVIQGKNVVEAYNNLMKQVMNANKHCFSNRDLFSRLPMKRKGSALYGLNGPQFFGFGLHHVRKALELLPGSEALAVPLTRKSSVYRFCYNNPNICDMTELQRRRAVSAAEKALENSSGSARTEGMSAVDKSGGSGRITRALVRSADEDVGFESGSVRTKNKNGELTFDKESNQAKYAEMKSVPLENRLAAKRSHIHGWGLFTKVDLARHAMIIEYMGEVVSQSIADKRERAYEMSGIGSCYMFRLDSQRIVDATMIGCMARFMNHCCSPNAYAKIITVETDKGLEKKIGIFANRDIGGGEEITYDYKFAVEDGSLRCTCGAPTCTGRMN